MTNCSNTEQSGQCLHCLQNVIYYIGFSWYLHLTMVVLKAKLRRIEGTEFIAYIAMDHDLPSPPIINGRRKIRMPLKKKTFDMTRKSPSNLHAAL